MTDWDALAERLYLSRREWDEDRLRDELAHLATEQGYRPWSNRRKSNDRTYFLERDRPSNTFMLRLVHRARPGARGGDLDMGDETVIMYRRRPTPALYVYDGFLKPLAGLAITNDGWKVRDTSGCEPALPLLEAFILPLRPAVYSEVDA